MTTFPRHLFCLALVMGLLVGPNTLAADPPNILFCISDDQSFAHTGANGDPLIHTPGFDRVAREGIRFTRAFCDAPSCGPSRSAILTGQPIWRLEEAGNIHSTLPAKFVTYPELLRRAGYVLGHTGKGWSPGRLKVGGRTENPAGPAFATFHFGRGPLQEAPRPQGMASNAYARNFKDFLDRIPKGKPFCFWLGTYEPHRGFARDVSGKNASRVKVPSFLPDHDIVRRDILDYCHEIEHFDRHVVEAMALLEQRGVLENTLVVVTSDHGMPFPRAKASLYDAGTHVPLAMRWPAGIKEPGRAYPGLVTLSSLAPTFLDLAKVPVPDMMIAESLTDVLAGKPQDRKSVYLAMERHDGCRPGGKGYPCRAIRTADFLYIRNEHPERWPAGHPDRQFCARDIPFGEVDSSPTKDLLMENKDEPPFQQLYKLAFGKRPAEELYQLGNDPAQRINLAGRPEFREIQSGLREQLLRHLRKTKDPRALGQEAPWDFYPYYGLRRNKDWKVDPKP